MDVATLRAEIKTWEKDFRANNGRDPTIQEIKDLPAIAEKYKLYKKLSKQISASSASQGASTSGKPRQTERHPPTTRSTPPPDSSTRPSTTSLLASTSKHRAVKTELLPTTSNPFSPVKHKNRTLSKGNGHDLSPDIAPLPLLLASTSRSNANPFTTPSKSKPRVRPRTAPAHSPVLEDDPFPLIDSHTLAAAAASSSALKPKLMHQPIPDAIDEDRPSANPGTAASSSNANANGRTAASGRTIENAVVRARKRLRGEPVSPSPVKEKRARIVPERVSDSGNSLFTKLQEARGQSSDDELPLKRGDEVDDDDTFIDDSPMKPAVGRKAFVKLFDEVIPAPFPQAKPKAKPKTQSKTRVPGLFAFGFGSQDLSQRKGKQRMESSDGDENDMDVDWDASRPVNGGSKLKTSNLVAKRAEGLLRKGTVKNRAHIPKAVIPGKDDLFDDSRSTKSVEDSIEQLDIQKRSMMSSDNEETVIDDRSSPPSRIPLLPPSPPPPSANSSSRYTGDKNRFGGTAKNLARKQTKLLEQLGDGDSDSQDEGKDSAEAELDVKEIPWSWSAKQGKDGVPGETPADSEAELDMATYPLPASDTDQTSAGETFEVNLPDELRRVLALSPQKKAQHPAFEEDEKKLVRGLIYGRREGNYDASRGGEIWGVGELGEEDAEEDLDLLLGTHESAKGSRQRDEEDDDWEGEPVPWEVGEL